MQTEEALPALCAFVAACSASVRSQSDDTIRVQLIMADDETYQPIKNHYMVGNDAAIPNLRGVHGDTRNGLRGSFFRNLLRLYSSRRRKPAMAINGRRNKPFGPGGSTRRLHQFQGSGNGGQVSGKKRSNSS